MTLITFEDGKVVFRDGAVGTEQACCCVPPCEENCVCILAGPCQAGGVYQTRQCVPETSPPYENSTPCDPTKPADPMTGNAACAEGTPTQVTITVTGVTCASGDAATDAEVEGLLNASYVVDLDCINANSDIFLFNNFAIFANVVFGSSPAPQGQRAGLFINGVSQNNLAINGLVAYDENGPPEIAYKCGSRLDCSDFSGPAAVSSNFSVLSGPATITVTGM